MVHSCTVSQKIPCYRPAGYDIFTLRKVVSLTAPDNVQDVSSVNTAAVLAAVLTTSITIVSTVSLAFIV